MGVTTASIKTKIIQNCHTKDYCRTFINNILSDYVYFSEDLFFFNKFLLDFKNL